MIVMKFKDVPCTLEAGQWKCNNKDVLGFLQLYSLMADIRDPSYYADDDLKIAEHIVKDGNGVVVSYSQPEVPTGEGILL
jgi:hypothetical protein